MSPHRNPSCCSPPRLHTTCPEEEEDSNAGQPIMAGPREEMGGKSAPRFGAHVRDARRRRRRTPHHGEKAVWVGGGGGSAGRDRKCEVATGVRISRHAPQLRSPKDFLGDNPPRCCGLRDVASRACLRPHETRGGDEKRKFGKSTLPRWLAADLRPLRDELSRPEPGSSLSVGKPKTTCTVRLPLPPRCDDGNREKRQSIPKLSASTHRAPPRARYTYHDRGRLDITPYNSPSSQSLKTTHRSCPNPGGGNNSAALYIPPCI
jgi:hypothetical protein